MFNLRFVLFVISLMGFFLFLGCSKSTDPETTGTLKISLTDAPVDFDAVNITFSEVSAHINDQWVTVKGDPITVNLLEWNNGNSIVLGTADVPAGHYTQIRLKIDDAEVILDGETHSVVVPSGAQTGLKLVSEFEVTPGSTYELVLDFDANRSVIMTGPQWNPTGFLLKPTVRVVAKALSGSISGVVNNFQHFPLAYAVSENDTVTSSYVDAQTGAFMLAFLPPQSYTVTVVDTMGASFALESVSVEAGKNYDLGEITLQ